MTKKFRVQVGFARIIEFEDEADIPKTEKDWMECVDIAFIDNKATKLVLVQAFEEFDDESN